MTMKIKPLKHADKIINYWKNEKFVVFCIIAFGITCNSLVVLGPIYQGKLIDAILREDPLNAVLMLSATYVGVILFVQLLRYFKRFYIRRFANINIAKMRLIIFNNIMHKSLADLDDDSVGNLMTRAISDVDLCVEGMRKFTTEVFDTGVVMFTYLIALLIYDVKLTLYAIVFVPVAMFLAEKLKNIIYKYSIAYRKKTSAIAELTLDAIDNSMLYRISGMEIQNSSRYTVELNDLQEKAIKANVLENSMQPIYSVIAMLGIVTIIYMGGLKVIAGTWTVGVFATYIAIFAAIGVRASKAAKLFNSVQKSQISWQRIKPLLGEYIDESVLRSAADTNVSLAVTHLTFSYQTDSEPILKDLSFELKVNQILGITGPIASGKSTLGISLLGFYPYLGSIRINNKELRDYEKNERSELIAYLGHKPQLLSDTIYNNITLGNPGDISAVLKDVCFEQDLETMPEGENTWVGSGGVRLSGGQQARIALARTLYSSHKILILDDPFSAVDMATEEKIIHHLKAHYSDRCILLISHRLAIFNRIDQVLLLHNDLSYELGSHDDLMSTSTLYNTIYTLQQAEAGRTDEK